MKVKKGNTFVTMLYIECEVNDEECDYGILSIGISRCLLTTVTSMENKDKTTTSTL